MLYNPDHEADDRYDLRLEFGPRPMRSPYGCSDQTCGAPDCKTCHPENFNYANEYVGEEL